MQGGCGAEEDAEHGGRAGGGAAPGPSRAPHAVRGGLPRRVQPFNVEAFGIGFLKCLEFTVFGILVPEHPDSFLGGIEPWSEFER